MSRRPSSVMRKAAALALLGLLTRPWPARAWQDLGYDVDPPTREGWFTMPARLGFLAPLLLLAAAFGFYTLFPWLLNRPNAPRPRAAYGLTAGLVWIAWCGIALGLFQDKMTLDTDYNGFVNDWLLTCLLALAALIGFALLRSIFGVRGVEA